MLPLSEIRKHLDPECKMSDEELSRHRDGLYELAEILVEQYMHERERAREVGVQTGTAEPPRPGQKANPER